jgi:hypothetical protein
LKKRDKKIKHREKSAEKKEEGRKRKLKMWWRK